MRVTRVLCWVLAGVFGVGSAGIGLAEETETVSLRPAWVEGQRALYEDRTEWQGEDVRRSGEWTFRVLDEGWWEARILWQVKEVRRDGSSVCVMVYESQRYEEKELGNAFAKNGEWIHRSAGAGKGAKRGENAGIVQDLMDATVGKELTFEVKVDGTVEYMSGLDAIRAAAKWPQFLAGEDHFVRVASELVVLPGVPQSLKIGEAWDHKELREGDAINFEVPTRYERIVETRLTRAELAEGVPVATLETSASQEFKIDPTRFPEHIRSVEARYVEPKIHSGIHFDLDRREVVARHERSEIRFTAELMSEDQEKSTQDKKVVRTRQLLRIEAE